MIIVVEGPDGAGKTTLAKKLAEALEYPYFHFGEPEPGVDQFMMSREFLANHNKGIIDRFYPSGIVYGEIMRGKPDFSPSQVAMLEGQFGKNIVMLYLTGDPSILWDRCQERGEDYVLDKKTFMEICRRYDEVMLEAKHSIPVHPVVLNGNVLSVEGLDG